jgi:hypothetical protein
VFRQLVATFSLEPRRSSKYRVAAEALGLVTTPVEGESLRLHA